MHGKMIAAALIGAALSAPAFAQGSGTPGSQAQGNQSSQSQGSQSQGAQAQGSQGQSRTSSPVVGQQQLRRQLEQAGFREVQVLDASYLVRARTQDGNSVFMIINPPDGRMQGAGMGAGRPSSATSGSSTGNTGASGGSGSSGSGSSSTPTR
jgi:hypothetical protein